MSEQVVKSERRRPQMTTGVDHIGRRYVEWEPLAGEQLRITRKEQSVEVDYRLYGEGGWVSVPTESFLEGIRSLEL